MEGSSGSCGAAVERKELKENARNEPRALRWHGEPRTAYALTNVVTRRRARSRSEYSRSCSDSGTSPGTP